MIDGDQLAQTRVRLLDGGAAIELRLDGAPHRFHALWLRDSAQDAETRSPANGQRLITLRDIPAATRVAEAWWTAQGLHVLFEPESKLAVFEPGWLLAHSYDRPARAATGWTSEAITRWDAAFSGAVPIETFEAIRTDAAARLRWLKAIQRYGAARLRGVPAAAGAAEQIAAQFGYIRETNYGRVFDVRVEVDPTNLAYTNLGLQAHTDNPYRDPAPGLQVLTCLGNDVTGGETILVDGFEVARRLQQASPRAFALLTGYNARFEYAGSSGVRLSAKKPIIELGPDGELLAVRFNNRSAAPFVDVPYDDMANYYDAYRRMAELVDDPGLAVRFRLEPGDAFVVDNQRVLHGRTAITGAGERHLEGCYVDKDGMLSTLAVLEQQFAQA